VSRTSKKCPKQEREPRDERGAHRHGRAYKREERKRTTTHSLTRGHTPTQHSTHKREPHTRIRSLLQCSTARQHLSMSNPISTSEETASIRAGTISLLSRFACTLHAYRSNRGRGASGSALASSPSCWATSTVVFTQSPLWSRIVPNHCSSNCSQPTYVMLYTHTHIHTYTHTHIQPHQQYTSDVVVGEEEISGVTETNNLTYRTQRTTRRARKQSQLSTSPPPLHLSTSLFPARSAPSAPK
jgi:hypothetical protein